MNYQPVVHDLVNLINQHGWADMFEEAVRHARNSRVVEMQNMNSTADYLAFINDLLTWVPSESVQGRDIYNLVCKFHFVLDQHPVKELQNAIVPNKGVHVLTPLSAWMVTYAQAIGAFLDTPESITDESVASFRASPSYNMHDYLEPRGGWKTFNELFARNFKPGYRPIAAVSDNSVIVSPADSTFDGQWEIRSDSQITLKTLHWKVSELLEGSPYADRFNNGMFMHSFLGPNDYHRLHAPVGGKVLESRFIPGQVYLQVTTEDIAGDDGGAKRLKHQRSNHRAFNVPDEAGYQFAQARGLVIIESSIGLVGVLPIGMSHVSSVIMTAEKGITLRKGEELAYFQFGGSDVVLLFEASSNVSLTAQVGTHYKMGNRIGMAYPV